MLHHWPTILAVWLATTLAGCAAPAVSTPTGPASPFDPQTLIDTWQGEWWTSGDRGSAYLEVKKVIGRHLSGRMYLRGYEDQAGSPSEDVESEFNGVVSERGGKVTLWFEGVLPGRLTVLGTRLQGVMSSDSVPSSITTLILDRVP
jgi:hypothetical protein